MSLIRRPIGKVRAKSLSMTPPVVVLFGSIAGAAPTTVTVSEMFPTSIWSPTSTVCPKLTLMSFL